MRKWYKYLLDPLRQGAVSLPIDSSFEDHLKGMGGYQPCEAYQTKKTFFDRYLPPGGRHADLQDFLKKRLNPKEKTLSVASGRAANELALMEEGYQITCSDVGRPSVYEAAQKLFPKLDYRQLNILREIPTEKYDAVIALSLIYLFDENDLAAFLQNVAKSLKLGGHLLLDSGGAPDNLLFLLWCEGYLKLETFLRRWFAFFRTGKLPGWVAKHHGYLRTDQEIIAAAEKCGFVCTNQENYSFLVEFRRSVLFSKWLQPGSGVENFFKGIGRHIPYIRMYDLKKVSE